jgi:hyperosmotically inducible protein
MNKIIRPLVAVIAAATLTLMAGCASTRTQESTGQYLDDSLITTKVKAAILGDSVLKSGEINVETFKGVVQLSGFVSSADARNQAVTVARAVEGVKSVKNDMQIK